jgi:acetyl esterase/lipase
MRGVVVRNKTNQRKSTYTYKRVGDLGIQADVYGPVSSGQGPVVVWIHGGALINGHRDDVPKWLLSACEYSGHTLVSVDYRLAPETRLPGIIQDIEDVFHWVRGQGGHLFGADPDLIAVVGESAGGYLALTAGFCVDPRLAAVVSIYGYGDLIGSWYSEPSPHPCHHEVELTQDEAFRQVSGPPLADERSRHGDGYAFYQFCRQRGLWPKAVSGWDPHRESDKFQAFMPVANVTADYPPTLLIHGERDTDVPHHQSVLMAAELAKHAVEHRLLSIAEAEHGLAGAEQTAIDDAFQEAAVFLRRHLAAS